MLSHILCYLTLRVISLFILSHTSCYLTIHVSAPLRSHFRALIYVKLQQDVDWTVTWCKVLK